MTMRYAHPTPENIRRAVDVLGKIFMIQNIEMPYGDMKPRSIANSTLAETN